MRFLILAGLVACGGSTSGDAGVDGGLVGDTSMPGDSSSGQPSCTEPRCTADPKPNDFTVMGCQKIQASACSTQYDDWARCFDTATMCDVATKQTDPGSRVAALNQCKPKFDAMVTCCNTNQVTCPTSR